MPIYMRSMQNGFSGAVGSRASGSQLDGVWIVRSERAVLAGRAAPVERIVKDVRQNDPRWRAADGARHVRGRGQATVHPLDRLRGRASANTRDALDRDQMAESEHGGVHAATTESDRPVNLD